MYMQVIGRMNRPFYYFFIPSIYNCTERKHLNPREKGTKKGGTFESDDLFFHKSTTTKIEAFLNRAPNSIPSSHPFTA